MGTPTRRAVLKGTAAFAGLAAVQASGLAPAAEAVPAGTSSGHPKANVLLVHGAWVDGSSWNRVIAILQRNAYLASWAAAFGVLGTLEQFLVLSNRLYDLAEWRGWFTEPRDYGIVDDLGQPVVYGALGLMLLVAGLVALHREDRAR